MSEAGSPVVPSSMAEGLRAPALMHAPDPRQGAMTSVEAHHQAMTGLCLTPAVPDAVRIAFDTARNLYLYAWHVYRFYPVAEAQALVTLEAGLRMAMPYRLPPKYQQPREKRATLFGLLNHAIDMGLVRNEGFSRWHRAGERKSRQRQDLDRLAMMEQLGLQELEFDPEAPVEVLPEDQHWDLVAVLRRSLSSRRNGHAHGEGGLTPAVYGTLELVCEILNQLFDGRATGAPVCVADPSGNGERPGE